MITTVSVASSSLSTTESYLSKLIEIGKKYLIKAVVHLGILGTYGFEFELDWPRPVESPFTAIKATISKDQTKMTTVFDKNFPVDVLMVEKPTIGKRLDVKSDKTITVMPGRYIVTNGNTVTFDVRM